MYYLRPSINLLNIRFLLNFENLSLISLAQQSRLSPVFLLPAFGQLAVGQRLFVFPVHVLLVRCLDYMSRAHQTSLLTNDLVND